MAIDFKGDKFTREDLDYYYKERPNTDFQRFIKVYKVIKEAEKTSQKDVKNKLETNLNLSKISKKSGLNTDIIRKKLEELKDLGVIDYHSKGYGSGRGMRIYLIKGKESSYLNEMLERARKEGLL